VRELDASFTAAKGGVIVLRKQSPGTGLNKIVEGVLLALDGPGVSSAHHQN